MKVMVGGTFDPLHIGHQLLLKRAFMTAGDDGNVIIGLSSDIFAARKQHPVRGYEVRKAELIRWIEESGFLASYEIEPLSDQFGSALTQDFDYVVESARTATLQCKTYATIRAHRRQSPLDKHRIKQRRLSLMMALTRCATSLVMLLVVPLVTSLVAQCIPAVALTCPHNIATQPQEKAEREHK